MPLTAQLIDEAIAATRQNAGEAAEALSRALGTPIKIVSDAIAPLPAEPMPAEWQNAGLAIVLKVEKEGVLAFLSVSSGLLPAWYAKPDATGVSKLTTLAQELGMVLLPEAQMPLDFAAGYVEKFSTALQRGGAAVNGGVTIPLQAGEQAATLYMLWPATQPDEVLKVPVADAGATASAGVSSASASASEVSEESFERSLASLPIYIRSLLQIKACVSVQLASRRQPVSRIVDMGPGTIVQFDRQCEQPLELFVNNLKIAEGEVVKVGDKFGLRITNILLPNERFLPIQQLANTTRKAS